MTAFPPQVPPSLMARVVPRADPSSLSALTTPRCGTFRTTSLTLSGPEMALFQVLTTECSLLLDYHCHTRAQYSRERFTFFSIMFFLSTGHILSLLRKIIQIFPSWWKQICSAQISLIPYSCLIASSEFPCAVSNFMMPRRRPYNQATPGLPAFFFERDLLWRSGNAMFEAFRTCTPTATSPAQSECLGAGEHLTRWRF